MGTPLLVQHKDVPIHWHEAVALVRSVADALESKRLRRVPAASELALESDGTLDLTASSGHRGASITDDLAELPSLADFPSELPTGSGKAAQPSAAARPVESTTQEVVRLRELLAELLPGDAPPQLRALAETKAVQTLAEFRAALAFFERPNFKADCRAVADRLVKLRDERGLQDEVERLRQKARAEDTHPSDRIATAAPRGNKPLIIAVAVLGLACGAAAVAVLVAREPVEMSDTASTQESAKPAPLVERLRAAAASVLGTSDKGKAAVVATPTTGAGTTPRSAPPRKTVERRTSAALPQRERDASSVTDRAAPPELVRLPAPDLSAASQHFSRPSEFDAIFSLRDADVQPPRLVRPHLPSAESVGLPRGQFGAVEVVVGVNGQVEQVRLVSTSAERRYYDIMILPAIKAWIFRPAIRSGYPVKYRLTIPLT